MNVAPVVAEWPRDALILLVGPSGAGKSTWAASRFEPYEVLEADAFRAMVANDPDDQSATADAFKLLHLVARARARRGLRSVVDATNLTTGARRPLIRLATRAARATVAVVFDVSLERCLEQNAARRDRHVPETVVRRHHEQLQGAKMALDDEGYLHIIVLKDNHITSP